ncbi:flagellar basal body-associated FliL family protein [Roseobacter weihaiensis]|uniref:hypothetical protein n=1 Tax=Roseobacter weihaiensis TaxID=2763262 RepID=UPI001D0BE2E8|nr:hypothetical protein [Roseobacter sp. H9]
MISIRPDPAHPRGGYAELSLSDESLAGETTQVAVFDNYSERYLGESGWQATKVMFGPYAVLRESGQVRVVIGPEIVNQIEEYANVKLLVGDTSQDVSWPDEIVPAPGAARIGGIMGAALKDAPVQGTLTAKMPEPEPEPDAPDVVTDPEPMDQTDAAVEEPAGSKTGMWIGLVAMVLLAAGIAYWFLNEADPTPVAAPAASVVTPDPVAEAPADPCGIDALQGLESFAAQATALRGCGSSASADAALGLVERAAAAGDAEALLLFGTVYDGQSTDPVIEDQIGLTFADVPATAAEYYARALEAGSQEAPDKLAALCARMAGMTDTLVKGAVADYCGQ